MKVSAPGRAWGRALPAVAGIILLLWILWSGRPPRPTLLWQEVYNLGHIPLFGLIALLTLAVSRSLLPVLGSRPFSHYLVAFVCVAVISLISEVIQLDVPGRKAEVQDAVHNLIGAVCFLAIWSAFDPNYRPQANRAPRGLLVGSALFALFVSSWNLIELGWHYGMRAAAFPVVVDLDGRWQQPFLSLPRANLAIVPAPEGWHGKAGQKVAEINFPHERWPGVTIREPYPDWTGYRTLRVQIFSPVRDPMSLTFSINDAKHNDERKDRFNRTISIKPGWNDISIALDDIRTAPANREMDLADITQIVLLTTMPDVPFRLYVSDIWLE
jgi:VanZ family protein